MALEMLLPILSLSNLALLTPRFFHYPNFLVFVSIEAEELEQCFILERLKSLKNTNLDR